MHKISNYQYPKPVLLFGNWILNIGNFSFLIVSIGFISHKNPL